MKLSDARFRVGKFNSMKRRIALILYYKRNLSTFPSVYNTAQLLIQAGYDVDLFVPESMRVDCNIEQLRILRFKPHKKGIVGVFRTLVTKISKYDLLISFQQVEFVVSAALSKVFGIPCIYFCLEISTVDDIKTLRDKIIKLMEVALNRRIDFTITQDESRKALIQKAHGLNPKRLYCVPNSYIGEVREKSQYLRDEFHIPDDRIIILYTGGIERWAIDEHLIEAVVNWNYNFVLVLHGWSRDGYIKRIRELVNDINKSEIKVYLSLDCLSTDDYMHLISSANVGLVWYKRGPTINVQEIGLSSGKFAAFMRCGLPVIVPSYLFELKRLVAVHRIGFSADSEYEINNCVEYILESREAFSDNAYQFYSHHLDFEKRFRDVQEKIRILIDI